jgi:hypothetical protein
MWVMIWVIAQKEVVPGSPFIHAPRFPVELLPPARIRLLRRVGDRSMLGVQAGGLMPGLRTLSGLADV